MDRELKRISEEIAEFIVRKKSRDGESSFNDLALRLFECQYRLIKPYGRFCRLKGKTPDTVENWKDIPSVEAEAFKRFFLFAGDRNEIAQTFRSSGTTQPGMSSLAHFSREGLQLMDLAVEVNALEHLFHEGNGDMPSEKKTPSGIKIFVLSPTPSSAPHLIMVHGMQHLLDRFGGGEGRFYVGARGLEVDALLSELTECSEKNIPAALMGSSFGFVHLFDEMEQRKLKLKLPKGSRLMDAGGYKGRSREIARGEFVLWASGMLGLEPERIVNLLGMTEMASQIYDGPWIPKLKEERGSLPMKETPHWVRTQVMNPGRFEDGDLEPVTQENQPGLLRHLDLANLERPMAIQTEDVGIRRGSGFDVLRRVKGAEPRGCSLTLEEFSARGER